MDYFQKCANHKNNNLNYMMFSNELSRLLGNNKIDPIKLWQEYTKLNDKYNIVKKKYNMCIAKNSDNLDRLISGLQETIVKLDLMYNKEDENNYTNLMKIIISRNEMESMMDDLIKHYK